MISHKTITELEKEERGWQYILGARMRSQSEVRDEVLPRAGRYHVVHPKGTDADDPSPLKVKEVWVEQRRYVICVNEDQHKKDAADRIAIVEALREQLKRGDKSLVGNKGYRKYHKCDETIRGHVFCSFLALVLARELMHRLETKGADLEWADVMRDLEALVEVEVEHEGKRFLLRSETRGCCGKVFQAVGVALPPTVRRLAPASST